MSSLAATKQRRRNWLLLALAGLLLVLGGIIVVAITVSSPQFWSLATVVATAGIPGGIGCLAIGLNGWFVDPGVRVSDDGSRGLRRYVWPLHTVRRSPRQKSKMVSHSTPRGA